MKAATTLFKAITVAVLKRYHRQMAIWYRKAAATHADIVIHTQHRVPTETLRMLRGKAQMHSQAASAIRVGE
ncbi:hypothetical protein ABH908_000445 [Pseudomonas frederiksbergensis]|uniref:hypothetical protein n=1 Tax=Pseudomonas TaxID=286 RepID=UPI003D19EC22